MDYYFFLFVRVIPLEEAHTSSLFLHILPQANFSGNIYACKIFNEIRKRQFLLYVSFFFLISYQPSAMRDTMIIVIDSGKIGVN